MKVTALAAEVPAVSLAAPEACCSSRWNPDGGIFFAFEGACGLAHPCPKLYQAGGLGKEPPAHVRRCVPACTCVRT